MKHPFALDRDRWLVELRRMVRFGSVGVLGFLVDGGILLLLTHLLSLAPIPARLASFSVAVVVGWYVNRQWSFAVKKPPSLLELGHYVGMQGIGLAINFVIFSFFVSTNYGKLSSPIGALAIASIAAMFFNYTSARIFVFRER